MIELKWVYSPVSRSMVAVGESGINYSISHEYGQWHTAVGDRDYFGTLTHCISQCETHEEIYMKGIG